MRTLALAATQLLPVFTADKGSPGRRLAAIAILQMAPNLEYLEWIVERMNTEQPFVLFHASLALRAMVRSFGARAKGPLQEAVRTARAAIQSFKSGKPDQNTLEILAECEAELANG